MSEWDSLTSIAQAVNSGKTTATELVEKSLSNIDKNKEYDAVIVSLKDRALERAKQVDSLVQSGKSAGRLAGVPFIAKDNFLVFGAETTAASNILKGFNAPYQSSAINRLEAEGAICVAKANLDAFAHGSSTENSDFMVTKNPHDKTRVAGGSSGGSAASVVLQMVPFALGSDTGGSIRLPASFSGCVGYKPSYGLVSRSGVVAMASSTDVIGPLTMNVEDAAQVLDIMAGKDELDATTIERGTSAYTELNAKLDGLKIGIVREYFDEGLSPEVKKAVEDSIDQLKSKGVQFIDVSIPSLKLALAAYYIICPAEVSSNLNRYDGQRFGYTYPEAKNLDESYTKSRSIGFGKEAKRRIMLGTYVLSSGYYDAYYKRAQIVRTKIINEFNEALKNCDFLIGPTAATVAFKIGERTKNPLEMYLADMLTVAANLVGVPAISLPIKTEGLPIGLHLMAKQTMDHALLSAARAVEEVVS